MPPGRLEREKGREREREREREGGTVVKHERISVMVREEEKVERANAGVKRKEEQKPVGTQPFSQLGGRQEEINQVQAIYVGRKIKMQERCICQPLWR